MKKISALIALMLFLMPTSALAHTGLSSSNPTEGQVLTEDLEQIELTYQGHIEDLSKMVLLKDGKKIEIGEIKIEESKMIGKLKEKLENGSYVVNWTIVGEDSHPVEGQVSFSVKKEEIEKEMTVQKEPVKKEKVKQTSNNEDENHKEEGSNFNIILSVIIFVLVVAVIGTIFRKGKK